VAASANVGQLKDELQRYVNSMGQATRLFEENGDPLALDVILENVSTITVLTTELKRRADQGAGYAPVPDQRLQGLLERYLQQQQRQAAVAPPS
jgi:hypothetical protein